jgi:hypothetical protein
LINATSFGGAYLVLKSIGDWTNTYPDEFNLSKKVKAGTVTDVKIKKLNILTFLDT